MRKSKVIGAIEIGTSKVVVLVGEIINGRSLNIIGFAERPSKGVRKGAVIDFKRVSDCTHAAIQAAEEQAKVRIEGVYLAQTGGHLEGFHNEASVTVKAADNLVSAEDIERVCENARAKALPEERSVIHYIRRPFRLDGNLVFDPELLEGKKLEVGYWIAHGELNKISDSIHIINGFSLHVDDLILSSLASGTMVAGEEERKNGTVVLDIGCGTIDYILYREGYVVKTGSVAVGGDHITNDLSLALRITRDQAEDLKCRTGKSTIVEEDKTKKVWLNGDFGIGDRELSQHAINQVINARVEEMFSIVKEKINEPLDLKRIGAGVILTGGTANLQGIAATAEKMLGLPARVGKNPSWVTEALQGLPYSTVLGLLNYGLRNQSEEPTKRRRRGLFRKIFA